MANHRILPFYLAYPMPFSYQEESTVESDLDYLMQMYPKDAKNYQRRISIILDKMDYQGSFIYDAYPDQITLYKLAQDISDIIYKEEEKEGNLLTDDKKEWIGELVMILLFYEIYKRRHTDRRGILKF